MGTETTRPAECGSGNQMVEKEKEEKQLEKQSQGSQKLKKGKTKKQKEGQDENELTGKAKRKQDYEDELIQGTNGSSIVSKRSVERLYKNLERSGSNGSAARKEYFRYFVKKPQRRSPCINRGYWTRMMAIQKSVEQFIENLQEGEKAFIVNLGCGYDPLPFKFLDMYSEFRDKLMFIDVDYPALIKEKVKMISQSEDLKRIIDYAGAAQIVDKVGSIQTPSYAAIECDLRNDELLKQQLCKLGLNDPNATSMFVAEVSLAYMEPAPANRVIRVAAELPKSHFVILEQILPAGENHPFARVMLDHFDKLSTPLKSVKTYPHIVDQRTRFHHQGYPEQYQLAKDLYSFWLEDISDELKKGVELVEEFDELEEFVLFCQHYIVLHAVNYDAFQLTDASLQKKQADDLSKSSTGSLCFAQSDVKAKPFLNRRFPAASMLGNQILINGGLSSTRVNSTVSLSPEAAQNVTITNNDLVDARMCHTITAFHSKSDDLDAKAGNEKLLLVGGRTSPSKALSSCYKLEVDCSGSGKTWTWKKCCELPENRSRHSSFVANNVVVVFGGLSSSEASESSSFMYYNDKLDVWETLESEITSRTSAVVVWNPATEVGTIFGGLEPGKFTICNEIINFAIDWVKKQVKIIGRYEGNAFTARYGAQGAFIDDSHILLGGGVSDSLLYDQNSTLVVWNPSANQVSLVSLPEDTWKRLPLLVGSCLLPFGDKFVFCCGGAVCFSFGSKWNDLLVFKVSQKEEVNQENPNNSSVSALLEKLTSNLVRQPPVVLKPVKTVKSLNNGSMNSPVDTVEVTTLSEASWAKALRENKPVVFTDVNLGECRKWTLESLKHRIPPSRVFSVHKAPLEVSGMSFQAKNFTYEKMSFASFLSELTDPSSQYRYYLRSLSTENQKTKPTDLKTDFPELAGDFVLPKEFALISENEFSSPLRIASPSTAVWLHYDVMANILCQIIGTKTVRLYPPTDISLLGFRHGDTTSAVENIFEEGDIPGTHPLEIIMKPGDVLFLPACWLHATRSHEVSVSINVFWKNLSPSLYAGGIDVYGNKDIDAYIEGRKHIEKIKLLFKDVPDDLRRFYLGRLASELEDIGKSS